MTQPAHSLRDDILDAYAAALAAVEPAPLVKRAVRQGLLDDWFGDREKPTPIHVLAWGKAAPRMAWGLLEAKVPFSGLGIAPAGTQVPKIDGLRWVAGEHPVPGEQSFAAGTAILDWVDALPDDAPVLVLLSGGASSLAEVAAPRVRREDLRTLWADWLRQGLGIDEMNVKRSKLSILKGGLLGERLLRITPRLRVWLLADAAPATAPAVVASGPFWLAERPERIPHHILASNEEAVAAAGIRLGSLGYQVFRHGRRIEADAHSEATGFLDAFAALPAGPVALVGGGEAPVAVPQDAPPGGRCSHAALEAANQMAKRGVDATFAALATDGNDGSSGAAGAVVTAADASVAAHRRFDAAGHLAARGRLLHAGPTGTNANDLWVALRR